MVETITPAVHGGSRTRWAVAVSLHAVAGAIVAGAFGAALGVAGRVLGAPWGSGGPLALALVAAWAFAHEAVGVPFPIPQLRRQVPDWWRTFFSQFASATLYGAALGIGFLTYLLHATLAVVALAAFVSGRPVFGALALGSFGLARGLSALAAVSGPDAASGLAEFARRHWPLRAVNAAAIGAVLAATESSIHGPVAVRPLALAVVALAFAWSAAWKALRPSAWRSVIDGYGLGRLAPAAAAGVPFAEAFVVVLAVAGARRASAVTALLCLVAFTGAAARRRLSTTDGVGCGCFGASETTFPMLLIRNAALAAAAVVAGAGARPFEVPVPTPADAAPIALSVVGCLGLLVAARSVRRAFAGSGE
jgi:hypothetical protein